MEENKSTTAVINFENINIKMKDIYDKIRQNLDNAFGTAADKLEVAAGGFHDTAEILREKDIQTLKETVKKTVKKHPMLSIGIAASLGFIFGRILNK